MHDAHTPIVEDVIRAIITESSGLPVRAAFYRGATGATGPLDPWTRYEHHDTPGCGEEWFVQVRPSAFEVCVSAAGRLSWGANDIIGDVTEIKYPQTEPGVVDTAALAGSRFHVEVLGAIRRHAAVVEQMRAAITS